MSQETLLGDYLRARRELVRPEDVGLPADGVRRVPGLRREEVALLAGISSDYYLRLEQGRDRNPSVQVLESLARVLLLDEPATRYLVGLAGTVRRRRRRPVREFVPRSTLRLLDAVDLPAFVEGRYFDVLAANDLARVLSPNLQVGRNRLRDMVLDPAERSLFPAWENMIGHIVARFREVVSTNVDDPRVVQLVGELSVASERFRILWARHDVSVCIPTSVHLRHPQVGDLELDMEKLAVLGTDGQLLVMHHAEPGSPSAEKLALLASLAASKPVDDEAPGRLHSRAEDHPSRHQP